MEEINKLFLAAVGGASLTYEKANTVLNDLVDKGRLTVDEGKVLAEDLKRRATGADQATDISQASLQEALTAANVATLKDIQELENRIDDLELKVSELNRNKD